MTEILAFLNTVTLPAHAVRANKFATVLAGGSSGFVASCVRMHERGDGLGLVLLSDYKMAVEGLQTLHEG